MRDKSCVLLFLFATLIASPADTKAQSAREGGVAPEVEIAGQVLDANTGRPVPGALVEGGELKQETVTDSGGFFLLRGLAPGLHNLRVTHSGYLSQRTEVAVPADALSILLVPLPDLREQVTVTASPWAAERHVIAQTTDSVDMATQRHRSGLSLGEAIKDIPGVRNVSTGEAGGVPMIRGLTNDRVRVLSHGFPHDYYQFSRRHMPNIEPFEASAVEVVRGPASVLYGSQAVGGVVNLIPPPLLKTEGHSPNFGGEFLLGYGANSDALVGRCEINVAHRGLSARAAWTGRSSGDTSTPRGPLANTAYDQQSALGEAGFQFENGIELRGRYQHWQNDLGFFVPATPHFRMGLRNDIGQAEARLPSRWGMWELAANFSTNVRRTFPKGLAGGPAVDLELDGQVYRAALRHPSNDQSPWKGWIQVEHGRQRNETFGPVALLPGFESRTWAAALYEEIRFGHSTMDRWIISFGLRYDDRRLKVPADKLGMRQAIKKSYRPVTGSAGLVYRFTPALSAGLSFARGWRNPSEYELLAGGPHDGVALYEKGNPSLRPETNLNTEASIRWDSARVRALLAGFRYGFGDYIHLRLTGEVADGLPVATFHQREATIQGLEASFSVDVSRHLTLGTTGDRLRSRNEATGARLPFTPPDRAAFSARFHSRSVGEWTSPYAEVRVSCTGPGRIAGLDEPFPLDTPGYALFDFGAGVQKVLRDTVACFDLWIGNIANRAYKDFLDTYKMYAFSPGRNIRVTGRWMF